MKKAFQKKIDEVEEYKRNYIEERKDIFSNLTSTYYATKKESDKLYKELMNAKETIKNLTNQANHYKNNEKRYKKIIKDKDQQIEDLKDVYNKKKHQDILHELYHIGYQNEKKTPKVLEFALYLASQVSNSAYN